MTSSPRSTSPYRVLFALLIAAISAIPALAQQSAEAERHSGSQSPNDDDQVASDYDSELNKIRDIAATTIDQCIHAIYVAALDRDVRSVLSAKLANPNYVYMGVRCLEDPGVPEQVRVLFDFDCRPGIFCLVDPNVLVVVDVVQGRVVDVIDPFIHSGGPTPGRHRPHIAFAARKTHHVVEVSTQGLKFLIDQQLNPPIRVDKGDTVEIRFRTGGNHDWTLEYFQNGSPQTFQLEDEDEITITAERAGQFEYYCSVSDHRALGMKGDFIVNP